MLVAKEKTDSCYSLGIYSVRLHVYLYIYILGTVAFEMWGRNLLAGCCGRRSLFVERAFDVSPFSVLFVISSSRACLSMATLFLVLHGSLPFGAQRKNRSLSW